MFCVPAAWDAWHHQGIDKAFSNDYNAHGLQTSAGTQQEPERESTWQK
jgi:conjugal transfer/entry exclusion protein